MKLSFIVPVYNVAPYLRKCVDSLLAQDYTDYEIILVDDGSTDNSGAICDEYASHSSSHPLTLSSSHPSIRTIHQDNAGLSAARNAGIMAARGTYLCFVDSDDYWQPNVLGAMMARIERDKLDVLRFDFQNVNEKYEVFLPDKYPHQVDAQVGIVSGKQYLNTRMGYACYAVMYIFRRELIVPDGQSPMTNDKCEKKNVLFTPGIHFEDVEWLPRMMLNANKVSSTTKVVYNYLVRQGSITKTQGDKEKIRRNIEDRLLIIDKYRLYREQSPDCLWLYNMQSSMVAGVLTAIAREFYEERRKYIVRLKEMNVFPLGISNQGKTYKRRAILINAFGPQLFCVMLHMSRFAK